jgi:hypothetical protein
VALGLSGHPTWMRRQIKTRATRRSWYNNPTTLSRFDMTVSTPYALLAYYTPYQEAVYVTSVSNDRR